MTAHGVVSENHPKVVPANWQEAMRRSIRSVPMLLERLELTQQDLPFSTEGLAQFPIFVTQEYLSRIRPRDPLDPLLLQVFPRVEESIELPGFTKDPVLDENSQKAPGILHKYSGRALLVTTGACAIHCRYCFRRHYPYGDSPKPTQWSQSLDYIRDDQSISEVILSGGDPLTLVDHVLSDLIVAIGEIHHVKRLRIHTRVPIVLPQRVTPELCKTLSNSRLAKWIVLHVNHPNEFDSQVTQAVRVLQSSSATLLNQAVLLRGVNDEVETLMHLCETLIDHNVVPYYLNQLDRVAGATHFEVSDVRALELVEKLRARLPGYAVPKLVRDIPGQSSKTNIVAI